MLCSYYINKISTKLFTFLLFKFNFSAVLCCIKVYEWSCSNQHIWNNLGNTKYCWNPSRICYVFGHPTLHNEEFIIQSESPFRFRHWCLPGMINIDAIAQFFVDWKITQNYKMILGCCIRYLFCNFGASGSPLVRGYNSRGIYGRNVSTFLFICGLLWR